MAALNRVPNEQSLATTLVGTQVFRDTPVTPTYKLYGTTEFTENRPITESDEYAGTWFADYAPTYGPNEISGTYAEDLTYEDVAILPRYLVKGGVTGVDDTNTVHGYLYTYTPTATRDDLDTMTVQHGFPGIPKQAEMVVFDQATISIDADNAKAVWQWSGNLWARKRDLITTVNDTATGGSTTTLIKTAAAWTVNAYQGSYVFIRSGAAAGNAIEIASNDATTLTFVGALPTAVATGNTFEISGRFTPGITDRTREKIAAPGTSVFIDDYPGGTIGTTSVPKWISLSVTYMNNLTGKRFGPDVDVYSAKLGRGKVKVTGQIPARVRRSDRVREVQGQDAATDPHRTDRHADQRRAADQEAGPDRSAERRLVAGHRRCARLQHHRHLRLRRLRRYHARLSLPDLQPGPDVSSPVVAGGAATPRHSSPRYP
jgi:hypothetical protein